MGEGTDAAKREVLAAREALGAELLALEAAGRAAVDIPSKVRRSPAKAAGLAAGAGFLLLGGPKRLLKFAGRVVRGSREELPPSMLPKEVDRALRKLGPDGEKVRGTLEREFADYLDAHAPERRKRDVGATVAGLADKLFTPLATRAGKQLAEQLFSPEGPEFRVALERARERDRDRAADQG